MSRAKSFNEKRRKAEEAAIERELDTGGDGIDFDGLLKNDTKDAAMGSKLQSCTNLICNSYHMTPLS